MVERPPAAVFRSRVKALEYRGELIVYIFEPLAIMFCRTFNETRREHDCINLSQKPLSAYITEIISSTNLFPSKQRVIVYLRRRVYHLSLMPESWIRLQVKSRASPLASHFMFKLA